MALTNEQEAGLLEVLTAFQNGKRINELQPARGAVRDMQVEVMDETGETRKMPLSEAVQQAENPVAGRYWVIANATPTAAGYYGSLAALRALPERLSLGRYLVTDDRQKRKLDPTDSTRYADGTPAALDGSQGQCMWCWNGFYANIFTEGGNLVKAVTFDKPIGNGFSCWIPAGGTSWLGAGVMDRTNAKLVSVISTDERYRGGNGSAINAASLTKAPAAGSPQLTMLGMPASNISTTNFGTYARKHGEGWEANWFVARFVEEFLFEVIMGTNNSEADFQATKDADGLYRGGFGIGVTNMNDWEHYNSYYPLIPTSVGLEAGDGVCLVDYDLPDGEGGVYQTFHVPVFFGLVHAGYGHLGRWVRGLIVSQTAGEKTEVYVSPSMYAPFDPTTVVLGTLLGNNISTSTALSFDGNAVASTQGERNLTGKSFTVDIMLNPATDQREMTVFSHGGDEKGMCFGLTADRKLSATINGETMESDTIVPFNNMLHQVAYVLDQSGDKTTVKFYDGSKAIGEKPLAERYEGTSSEICLGSDFDFTKDLLYKGEMLEFRLWNRAMSAGDLDSYSRKKLTGYETGLLDYYPMNEGEGIWAYDKAPGSMDLLLSGTSWKRPAGISMEIKGDKGLRLKPDKFARGKNHDYTLTFWFRTNDGNATLLSNGEAKYGQADQLNIGIKDSILYVRSQGFERKISAFVSEGSWHHFAMTVSRSQNVSNVYVDKKLVESFPADSVGGILGNDITLGATFVDRGHQTNVMKGHIDEVGMYESVLPLNLIKEYANYTPLGTMSALLAYLDFGRSEKMDDNTQHLEPTGISLKRHVNSRGEITARRDTLVADADVDALAARDFYAPMVSNAQLDNLWYSYVANGNELYMNIKQPDYMVEKTNIYVTVKEVPDLQGNLMASPITLNLYVYRNPLRWDVKRIEKDVRYGEGVTFEATVKNLSGVTQDFKLEDLPLWINASQTQGVLDALDEQTITFTVSDYINIGTYNEQIALIGDNMMSEPLPITLRVRGDEPDWTVPDRLKQNNQTMMMVARVKIDGVVASSKEDILAVFDDKQQVLGVAHIEVNDNANANEALAYLTIYGYNFPNGTGPTLNFRFFDASSGNVYSVTPADSTTYNFQQDAIVGTDANPVVLKNSFNSVQTLKLKTGWNWVSFYVIPKEGTTLGQFLNSMSKWEVGEVITVVNGTETRDYYCRENAKAANGKMWDNEDDPITIHPEQMYSIYSKSDKTIYLEGEFARRYITVHKDWNRVGYNSTINLPISQALADYLEKAQEGDVVKSQDGFAIASQSATGLVWKGNLQYMEAGKGYMFKRQADSEVQFLYPLYFDDSRYSSTSESRAPRRASVNTATTMNIVAAVDGVETEKGDRLVVFCGAERIAEATADDEKNYYLNIGSDFNSSDAMTFMIERDGEPIAMTGSSISYAPNKVLGTPDNPTVISFVSIDQIPNDGKWYTVGGIQIDKKPTQSGVYIHNGKAVVVR